MLETFGKVSSRHNRPRANAFAGEHAWEPFAKSLVRKPAAGIHCAFGMRITVAVYGGMGTENDVPSPSIAFPTMEFSSGGLVFP